MLKHAPEPAASHAHFGMQMNWMPLARSQREEHVERLMSPDTQNGMVACALAALRCHIVIFSLPQERLYLQHDVLVRGPAQIGVHTSWRQLLQHNCHTLAWCSFHGGRLHVIPVSHAIWHGKGKPMPMVSMWLLANDYLPFIFDPLSSCACM